MKIVLVDKKIIARDTLALFFKSLSPVKFLPGQFIFLEFELDNPGPRGNIREFSLASSPREKLLQIITRLRSGSEYKKVMSNLALGTELIIDNPSGVLHLEDSDLGPHVFIAGGTGIAPFRSRLRHNIDLDLGIPMHVIYSNSTSEDIAFKRELDEWSGKYPFIGVDYVVSSVMGRLNRESLGKLISKFQSPSTKYWICGSPSFVNSIETFLLQLKIDPEKVITEKFTGY